MSKGKSAPIMKDAAQEAGVAIGTVSKVINGVPAGKEYRIRVEKAVKKLNYHPKLQAPESLPMPALHAAPGIRREVFQAVDDDRTPKRDDLRVHRHDPGPRGEAGGGEAVRPAPQHSTQGQ